MESNFDYFKKERKRNLLEMGRKGEYFSFVEKILARPDDFVGGVEPILLSLSEHEFNNLILGYILSAKELDRKKNVAIENNLFDCYLNINNIKVSADLKLDPIFNFYKYNERKNRVCERLFPYFKEGLKRNKPKSYFNNRILPFLRIIMKNNVECCKFLNSHANTTNQILALNFYCEYTSFEQTKKIIVNNEVIDVEPRNNFIFNPLQDFLNSAIYYSNAKNTTEIISVVRDFWDEQEKYFNDINKLLPQKYKDKIKIDSHTTFEDFLTKSFCILFYSNAINILENEPQFVKTDKIKKMISSFFDAFGMNNPQQQARLLEYCQKIKNIPIKDDMWECVYTPEGQSIVGMFLANLERKTIKLQQQQLNDNKATYDGNTINTNRRNRI